MKAFVQKIILVTVLVISSTAVFAQTPIEVNNTLVSIVDSLYAKGKTWGIKLKEVIATKKFESLKEARTDMQNYISKKITDVKKMKDVNGSAALQNAFLDFLLYEKNLVASAFIPFEKLTAASTDKELKAAGENLSKLGQDESEKMAEFQKVQQEYAAKNGFTISQ